MPEFVHRQDSKQRQRERNAKQQKPWMLERQNHHGEGIFVARKWFDVMRVGQRKFRAHRQGRKEC